MSLILAEWLEGLTIERKKFNSFKRLALFGMLVTIEHAIVLLNSSFLRIIFPSHKGNVLVGFSDFSVRRNKLE